MLKLYNYLTRKIEPFEPLNSPKVTMYSCGPTVYDYPHIGNLRTFVFEDVLQRVLEMDGYEVVRVMNITDIEDKIIKKATEQNLSIEEITQPFEKAFFEDLDKLNIKRANVFPKATEHVGKMVKYISELLNKDLAYVERDGSVYFDISKFPNYGRLSQIEKRELKTGTRVAADEYTRESVQDFALWKAVKLNEIGYESPWGRGRPGWHIECSVMSQEYLGPTLDIHAGAVDLIFPHHENEIAQSEGMTGVPFTQFFVEGEHLLVDGQKMSKSLKNYYTLRDIEARGFEPLVYRYLTLTAHYRDKLNFTWESLEGAKNALNNLREEVRGWLEAGEIDQQTWEKFMEAANNDLNIPQALVVVWEMVKGDLPTSTKAATILKMDQILGLKLEDYLGKPVNLSIKVEDVVKVEDKPIVQKELDELGLNLSAKVEDVVNVRDKLRLKHQYAKADIARDVVERSGFEIEDTAKGRKVKKTS